MYCMSRQLTVRIPEDLSEELTLAVRKLRITPSEIVRLALRQFLRLDSVRPYPAQRVSELLGSLDSGIPDLATRHRDYILESLRNSSRAPAFHAPNSQVGKRRGSNG